MDSTKIMKYLPYTLPSIYWQPTIYLTLISKISKIQDAGYKEVQKRPTTAFTGI
jgi:hypothetical protein